MSNLNYKKKFVYVPVPVAQSANVADNDEGKGLPNNTTEDMWYSMMMPDDCEGIESVNCMCFPTVNEAETVCILSYAAYYGKDGESIYTGYENNENVPLTIPVNSRYLIIKNELPTEFLSEWERDQCISLKIGRVGNNAGDTSNSVLTVAGVLVEYMSNSR